LELHTSSEEDMFLPPEVTGMDQVIAVDLGATTLRVALVTSSGEIRKIIRSDTPKAPKCATDISDLVIRMVYTLCSRNSLTLIQGIGISAAGPVNQDRGCIIHPPNIFLEEIPLAGPLNEEFGLPVHLINDCHAGILGEVCFGAAKDLRNVVYITISTGIGAGIISNGKIILGKRGNAGEIGHLFVDSRYQAICSCGHYGHWEGYSSGRFLPRFFHQWCELNGITRYCDNPGISAREIFLELKNDTQELSGFQKELGVINARGISDVIVSFEPELIIFDGAVITENIDLLLPHILKNTDRFLPIPDMKVSPLKGMAPLLGASVIAQGYDTIVGNFFKRS
jgi:glucokinase